MMFERESILVIKPPFCFKEMELMQTKQSSPIGVRYSFVQQQLYVQAGLQACGKKQDAITYIVCPHNKLWAASLFLKNVASAYADMGFGTLATPFYNRVTGEKAGVVTYCQEDLKARKKQKKEKEADLSLNGWLVGLRKTLEELQRHLLFESPRYNRPIGRLQQLNEKRKNYDEGNNDEQLTVIVYIVPPNDSEKAAIRSLAIASQLLSPCLKHSTPDQKDIDTNQPKLGSVSNQTVQDPSTPQSDPIVPEKTNKPQLQQSDQKRAKRVDLNENSMQAAWKQLTPYEKIEGEISGRRRSLMERQLFSCRIRLISVLPSWLGLGCDVSYTQVANETQRQATNKISADGSLFMNDTPLMRNLMSFVEQSQHSFQDSNMKDSTSINNTRFLSSSEIQILNTDLPLYTSNNEQDSLQGIYCCYTFQLDDQFFSQSMHAVVIDSKGKHIRSGVKFLGGFDKERDFLQQGLSWVVGYCLQNFQYIQDSDIQFVAFQKLGLVSTEEKEIMNNLIQKMVKNLTDLSSEEVYLESLQFFSFHSIIVQNEIEVNAKNRGHLVQQPSIKKSSSSEFYFIFPNKLKQQANFSKQFFKGFCLICHFLIKVEDSMRWQDTDAILPNLNSLSPYSLKNQNQYFTQQKKKQRRRFCLSSDEQLHDQIQQDLVGLVKLSSWLEIFSGLGGFQFSINQRNLCLPFNCVILMQLGGLYKLIGQNCVQSRRT
eukprot:TRINITY_DN50616_c0_g1_i4.p1 TRINITY_DN50616_c0_g1~~TRINITY_DN50616_c0_g1_i4.p1  ORF type:complete len:712 (-),score=82.70 TRINITY_DN50616_c0_g1_i4:279-2414(-)